MDSRQKVIEEAANMFRTYGIRAVTMDMLAGRLGISKRTIYEMFRDKDELLVGVVRWMVSMQNELITNTLNESENVIEAIFRIIDLTMDHFQKMSPAFQMDIKRFNINLIDNPDRMKEMPFYSNNIEVLKRGIREGIFREDIDLVITNKCMHEVVRLSNENESLPIDHFFNRNVIRNLYINYLRGISTPKGLDLINRYESGIKSNSNNSVNK